MRLQGISPERPLTHDLFAATLDRAGRAHRAGRHRLARRRDVPRPAGAGHRGQPPRAWTPARRTRSRWRCASSARSTRRRRCWTRPPRCPTTTTRATRTRTRRARPLARKPGTPAEPAGGRLARGDRGEPRPHEARHLPRVRELPGRRGRAIPEAAVAASSRARSPRIGRPRRRARSAFAHRRSRSIQKSFTARQITDGLAPVGEPGGPRVVRDADLGDRSGPAPRS